MTTTKSTGFFNPHPSHPQAVDEMIREFMNEYPGVGPETALHAVLLTLGAGGVYPEPKALEVYNGMLQRSVALKEAWAMEVLHAVNSKKADEVRPTYDKAVALGLDPAAALRLNHDLGEIEAAELVALLASKS